MRAVLQKSENAKCEVNGEVKGKIDNGLVILLGICEGDGQKDIDYLVEKIINLRLFEDKKEEKHFEKSLSEINGEALVISQFTLYAGCDKGRRPSFIKAAKGEISEPLYKKFVETLKKKGIKVATGEFGAMMKITLTNKGPVTIMLESPNKS